MVRARGPIADETDRRNTFSRRKQGLFKKAHVLSTLCGVDACVVVYGDPSIANSNSEAPDIWPPDPTEVTRVIKRYEHDRDSRRKYNKRKADKVGPADGDFVAKKSKIDYQEQEQRPHPLVPDDDEVLATFSEERLRSMEVMLGDNIDAAKERLAAKRKAGKVGPAADDFVAKKSKIHSQEQEQQPHHHSVPDGDDVVATSLEEQLRSQEIVLGDNIDAAKERLAEQRKAAVVHGIDPDPAADIYLPRYQHTGGTRPPYPEDLEDDAYACYLS